jgi:N-acetylmuramoyl-L-alanine amidase
MKKRTIGLLMGVLLFCAISVKVLAGGNITAPKPEPEYPNLFDNSYDLSESEIDLLAAITYYEANTEDMTGKRLVVAVVLNRVDSEFFPDNLTDVLSAPGQFSTYKNAVKMKDTDIPIDCYGAVLAELEERTDSEPLYFSSEGYNGKTHLYKHGNHYFSK